MDIWTEVQRLCDAGNHERLREIALEDTEYSGSIFLTVLNNLARKADFRAARAAMSLVREAIDLDHLWEDSEIRSGSEFNLSSIFSRIWSMNELRELVREFSNPEFTTTYQNWIQAAVLLFHKADDPDIVSLWEALSKENSTLFPLPLTCRSSEWRLATCVPDNGSLDGEASGQPLLYRTEGEDALKIAVTKDAKKFLVENRDSIAWSKRVPCACLGGANINLSQRFAPFNGRYACQRYPQDYMLAGRPSGFYSMDVDAMPCLDEWQRVFHFRWSDASPFDGCHMHLAQTAWSPNGQSSLKDSLLDMGEPVFSGLKNRNRITAREWTFPRALATLFQMAASRGHHFLYVSAGWSRLQAWQSAAMMLGIPFESVEQVESAAYSSRWFAFGADTPFFIACPADYPADQWSCSTIWGMGLACLSPISGKMTVLSVASSDG